MVEFEKQKSVQVQVKEPGKKSQSLTLYDTNAEEVFNRIYFLFDTLAKAKENNIKMVCYKKGNIGEDKS